MSAFVADKIKGMTDENGNIIVMLTTSNFSRTAARKTVEELKDYGKGLQIEIKPYKSHRSLKQNAMLWGLIEKIAEEESGYKRKVETMDVYCDILEQANCAYEWILAPDQNALQKAYRAVRKFGSRDVVTKDGEIIEMNLYKCYIGSSKFNVSEMKELIECALDICAQLGIDDSETELTRATYAKPNI